MKNNNLINLPSEGESKIDLFKKKGIRKVLHDKEWWLSVKDVIEAITDTPDGTRYVSDLRKKDPGLNERYSEITRTLIFKSGSGKQKTNFINIEGVFRLIQSVPSKKAEPFKKWLAKVGFERLQEIQNPELAVKRAVTLYKAKGYDDEWIEARIRNKTSRDLLTSEWDKRGMTKYIGLLTDSISVETFGVNTSGHKKIKKLKTQSLRDNMTPIELTLTTLGEQTTNEIIKTTDPRSLEEHKIAAVKGGRIAGAARIQIEEAIGKSVVSDTNYLTTKQRTNNLKSMNPKVNEMMNTILNTPGHTNRDNGLTLDGIVEVPSGTSQDQLIRLSGLLKSTPGQNRIAIHLPNGKLIPLEYGVNYDGYLIKEISEILTT